MAVPDKHHFIDSFRYALDTFRTRPQAQNPSAASLVAFTRILEKSTSTAIRKSTYSFTPEEIAQLEVDIPFLSCAVISLLADSMREVGMIDHLPSFPAKVVPPMEVAPFGSESFLCELAEDYLVDAIDDGSAVLVNHDFIYKRVGIHALYSLEDTYTADGVFLAKHWYKPFLSVRDRLENVSARRLTLPQSGWMLSRPIGISKNQRDPEDVHAYALEFAQKRRQ